MVHMGEAPQRDLVRLPLMNGHYYELIASIEEWQTGALNVHPVYLTGCNAR